MFLRVGLQYQSVINHSVNKCLLATYNVCQIQVLDASDSAVKRQKQRQTDMHGDGTDIEKETEIVF